MDSGVLMTRKEGREVLGRTGSRIEIALRTMATQLSQHPRLHLGFNPLGDDVETEGVGE